MLTNGMELIIIYTNLGIITNYLWITNVFTTTLIFQLIALSNNPFQKSNLN